MRGVLKEFEVSFFFFFSFGTMLERESIFNCVCDKQMPVFPWRFGLFKCACNSVSECFSLVDLLVFPVNDQLSPIFLRPLDTSGVYRRLQDGYTSTCAYIKHNQFESPFRNSSI